MTGGFPKENGESTQTRRMSGPSSWNASGRKAVVSISFDVEIRLNRRFVIATGTAVFIPSAA